MQILQHDEQHESTVAYHNDRLSMVPRWLIINLLKLCTDYGLIKYTLFTGELRGIFSELFWRKDIVWCRKITVVRCKYLLGNFYPVLPTNNNGY